MNYFFWSCWTILKSIIIEMTWILYSNAKYSEAWLQFCIFLGFVYYWWCWLYPFLNKCFMNPTSVHRQYGHPLVSTNKAKGIIWVFATNSDFLIPVPLNPELKTLEWNIPNPDYLIWVSNGHTFDFLLNPLFLDTLTV